MLREKWIQRWQRRAEIFMAAPVHSAAERTALRKLEEHERAMVNAGFTLEEIIAISYAFQKTLEGDAR